MGKANAWFSELLFTVPPIQYGKIADPNAKQLQMCHCLKMFLVLLVSSCNSRRFHYRSPGMPTAELRVAELTGRGPKYAGTIVRITSTSVVRPVASRLLSVL